MSDKDELDNNTLAILTTMPFGVYYCNRKLIVKYINESYAGYLGLRPADIIGKKITDFIPNSRARIVMDNNREELYQESSILSRKARQKILVNRIPCRDKEGTVIGFISQLMSVGDDGWRSIYNKIEHAEQSFHRVSKQQAIEIAHSDDIVCANEKMKRCLEKAHSYAQSDEPVLIYGPTGVGKELFARAIQRNSRRAQKPFICVNCASISKEFINSELFGYAPGAFTGAHRHGKPGLMEKADGGTLFLDEIGDLPLDAQGALLRALETHQIQRINALEPRTVDFRLITATNRDLQDLCGRKQYREDLFFRLSVLPLHIPALKDRKDDLPLLISHFMNRIRGEHSWRIRDDAMDMLVRYSWPGNVRELRNALVYAAVNATGDVIDCSHLPQHILDALSAPFPAPAPAIPAAPAPDDVRTVTEKDRLVEALQRCGGNISCMARLLGLSRTTIYARLKQYGIARRPFPDQPPF